MRMTRLSKVTSVSLAVVATVALAGCTPTNNSNSNSNSGQNSGSSSALAAIQQRGTLRVADCLSFAPFGFKNADGNPEGYDIDIANAMAKELGVKLEVTDTTSANRIPNLQTGKVDVVICNFTRTGERAKQIEFTDPYVVASEALLVKKDSRIQTLNDLAGKTLAAVKGSTDVDIVKSKNVNVKTQNFDTSQAAILAVKQGQADAMIEDTNFLAYQAKIDPSLAVTKEPLVPLEYNGMGVKQGDQVWVNWLNQFLFDYNTSGQNAEAYQKWFGVKQEFPLRPQY